jgi:hypothetical protein
MNGGSQKPFETLKMVSKVEPSGISIQERTEGRPAAAAFLHQ